MKTIELMDNHEYNIHIGNEVSANYVAMGGAKTFHIDRLENEYMFTATIKECIPGKDKNKECKTFVPPNKDSSSPKRKERVAVLAPPGKVTNTLLKFISILLMKGAKEKNSTTANTVIDILPETHMAPYGYGSNHGYTRIIRVVPQPLLLGATDTLKAAVKSISSSSSSTMSVHDITLNDLKAALRQQVRYHCRLNHVAAHTAMWTIGLEDFAEADRDMLVENAKDFFGLNSQDNLIHEVIDEYENKIVKEIDDDDNVLVRLNDMYSEGESLLNLVQINNADKRNNNFNRSGSNVNILKLLDDVLLDEMMISKNLTAWPCQSFWTVGEREERLKLSPIIQHISKAMSPNCTAPYTSCFVKRDKCESNGDGKCR